MKARQVEEALRQKFLAEDQRLVFWHDPESEFRDYVSGGLEGELAEVQVLDVAAVGGLSAKLRLEREQAETKFLVYSQGATPPADEDWLLDIRLYSAEFDADIASLWLQELGLPLSLRAHLKARVGFLGNQSRREKLGRLVAAEDDEAALDLKMMAVLVRCPMPRAFDVLSALCQGHVREGEFDLRAAPEILATFEKLELADRFWELMRAEFAYESDEPTVAGLLRGLFASELCQQLGVARLESIEHLQLPRAGRRNAIVFLTQWRDHAPTAASYDAVASALALEQDVKSFFDRLDLAVIRDVYTFWEAEAGVASALKNRLLEERRSVDLEDTTELAAARKAGHWLAGPGRDGADRKAIAAAYDAIVAAAELFALHAEHERSLRFDSPGALLDAYQRELYQFDRLYRTFHEKACPARHLGWNLLKTLEGEVERVYDHGFIQPLGVEWSRLLEAGFLDEWSFAGLPPQQGFFDRTIRKRLKEAKDARAFVIISDAFRYEAATELAEVLNGKYRMDANLTGMLGVLPSYTALGMASLLPHKTLGYDAKGEVLVDGKSVGGTDTRGNQLATVGGMACQAKPLLRMKKDEAREFTKDKRVVYIYHNVIDAIGDNAATEEETFDAVTDCIEELADLVQFCVNNLNAGRVFVTADHGFLYQQEPPNETDKSRLAHKPAHAVKIKKRYVIGPDLGQAQGAHHGRTAVTAGAEGGMEFWVPRAANRFHFVGGARFVHGGAMPQEVIVPLLTVTHVRGKKKADSRVAQVGLQVLGDNHKITASKYRFEVIQTDAVGARRKPVTVRAAIYDGQEVVSSVETLTFDSSSDRLEDRKKSFMLTLRSGTYDRSTAYRLVLRDVASEREVQAVAVVIDRSFDDDF